MYDTIYGAGYGYADSTGYADSAGEDHTTFLVWLIVFALAAVAILGGLKVGGFHFVVKV
jgi:hypothetical protein